MTDLMLIFYKWFMVAFSCFAVSQVAGNWKRDPIAGYVFWILAPVLIPVITILLLIMFGNRRDTYYGHTHWWYWLLFCFFYLFNLNPDKK